MDELDERETEIALLGSILKKPAQIQGVSEIINGEVFTWGPYRDIYNAALSLKNASLGVDTVTVGDELSNRGLLDGITIHDSTTTVGRIALSFIRDEGRPDNAVSYAQLLKNRHSNREILRILSEGAKWVSSGRPPGDILGDLTNKLSSVDVSDINMNNSTHTINSAVERAVDIHDRAARGDITFLKTGLKLLDKTIVGFSPPDLTIVAARPGVGKTAFLNTVINNIMKSYKKRILYFSLEMAAEQVAMRFISMRSGISYQKQRSGTISGQEYDAYYETVGDLTGDNYPLFINDLSTVTPSKMRREIRRIGNIDLVVLDYLQLADADNKHEARHLDVAAVSRACKAIAKDFNIPVLVAAQLSRASTSRAMDNQRPIMSDLAESGSIERDADNIIFLHREAGAINTEIILAKHRNGETGMFEVDYVGEKTMFRDRLF